MVARLARPSKTPRKAPFPRRPDIRIFLLGSILLTGVGWDEGPVETDDSGHFEFPGVAPGKYIIRTTEGAAIAPIEVGDKEVANFVAPAPPHFIGSMATRRN